MVPEETNERGFEIGKDEAWFANIKRTYDEFQHESLETLRQLRRHVESLQAETIDGTGRNRTHFDKMISDAQQYDNQRQTIANQALQNAVETANMTGKQGVRNADIAIDRTWNIDEVAAYLAKAVAEGNKATKAQDCDSKKKD